MKKSARQTDRETLGQTHKQQFQIQPATAKECAKLLLGNKSAV